MSLKFLTRKLVGCTQRNNGILCILNQVRYAGGGGRPGGKPTLNWKERKILRLSNKGAKKLKKLGEQGYYEDIEHLFDESRGDKIFDFESIGDGEMMEFNAGGGEDSDEVVNDKMTVSVPSLFGSSKAYGLIERNENKDKKRFSHARVFGYAPRLNAASYGGMERKKLEKAAKAALIAAQQS